MKLSFMISNLLSEIVETIASHLKKKTYEMARNAGLVLQIQLQPQLQYLEYETGKIILFWDIL